VAAQARVYRERHRATRLASLRRYYGAHRTRLCRLARGRYARERGAVKLRRLALAEARICGLDPDAILRAWGFRRLTDSLRRQLVYAAAGGNVEPTLRGW